MGCVEAIPAMSFWQFNACRDGWLAANGGESEIPPPTEAQHDYLVAKYRGGGAKRDGH